MPATQLDAIAEPPNVEVLNGEVVLRGPRIALTLTAAAAAETGRLLTEAATRATDQRVDLEALGVADLLRGPEDR